MTIHICLFGGGNITNLRHIPALRKVGRTEVSGLVGRKHSDVIKTSNRLRISNSYMVNDDEEIRIQLDRLPWFSRSDAVLIGTPPRTHYALSKACLELGKHVLTEKPMVMTSDEGTELADLSKQQGLKLCVMHNFQYANGVNRLKTLINKGELGRIASFHQIQLTSRERRLPSWYQDLPLGLFYDEAAHFFYLLQLFGGPITIHRAFSHMGADRSDSTPLLMCVDMTAGDTPSQLTINFNSPVCEWLMAVVGEKRLALYDFFRDILTVLPNDGQHLALDILRTSVLSTVQHWKGFISSGMRLITGQLHYGVDVVLANFLDSIEDGKVCPQIDVMRGIEIATTMHQIVDKIQKNFINIPVQTNP